MTSNSSSPEPHGAPAASRQVDKIERYKWQVKDRKGTFGYVSKGRLQIDRQHYQRPATNEKILQLARDWSWVACGAISVAKRSDGSLFVMDGQYRLLASLRRSDIHDLPCMIFDVEDVKEEAIGFLNVNNNRKAMKRLDRFKAEITAEEEASVFIDALLTSINRAAGGGKGEVRCVGSLISWAKRERAALIRLWPLLHEIAGSENMPHQLVDGLMFLELAMAPGRSLGDRRNYVRLVQIGQKELLASARSAAHFRGKGGAKIWADGICQRFNKGLQNRLETREGALSF